MSNRNTHKFGDAEIYLYEDKKKTIAWIYLNWEKNQNEIDYLNSNKKFKILLISTYIGDWGYLEYKGAKNVE